MEMKTGGLKAVRLIFSFHQGSDGNATGPVPHLVHKYKLQPKDIITELLGKVLEKV